MATLNVEQVLKVMQNTDIQLEIKLATIDHYFLNSNQVRQLAILLLLHLKIKIIRKIQPIIGPNLV